MTSQGYSTLAIDNLGNGGSDHPDPINMVQLPLQLELIQEIMKGLKAQSFSCIPKKYNKIIFATHSYGSLVGRQMAMDYPDNGADAYILTATSTLLVGIQAASQVFQPVAASAFNPSKYSDLPPAYVHVNPDSLKKVMYSLPNEYDPALRSLDENQPHLFAVGELVTFKPNLTSTFTGPVMYLTGRLDPIVCDPAGDISKSIPDCGVGRTSNPGYSRSRFPNATPFGVYVPDRTGHNLNLEFSASESFGAVAEFLDGAGF